MVTDWPKFHREAPGTALYLQTFSPPLACSSEQVFFVKKTSHIMQSLVRNLSGKSVKPYEMQPVISPAIM